MKRAAVLLALVACKKPGPIEIAVPEPVDPWSDAALAAYVDEIVPLVEKHAGREFTTRPPLEVFDPQAFAVYVGKESKLIMDTIYRDTPEPVRQAQADADAKAQMGGLFGKFGIFDGKTYIVPSAIESAGDELGDDGAVKLAKLVIAHEITHALQNQEHDAREQLDHIVDLDHFHGWSAVSEGGANFVAFRVAQDLGLEEEFWTLSSHQGWGKDGLAEPYAYDIWMRYGRGMHMLEEVVEAEGMEGFWRWHAQPPVSSSMIFRPATYATELPPRPVDLAEVLRGTDQKLTQGPWMASNTRLGEYTLRGEAIRTGKEEEFDPILAHLVDAQHLDLTLPDRKGDIRVMVFDAPEQAKAYLDLLRAEQTVEGQLLAKMLGVTVEVTYTEVNGVDGDASLLRTQRVPVGVGVYREERTAWVVRGRHVVAVNAASFRPGLRLAATLNAVFANLEAAGTP
ncbi:MAG: hypothetical protein H6737_31815 [Alphaproteobacteria bacterium]|nr:hypothetical protein [Alphaproteobacteria bacterium]